MIVILSDLQLPLHHERALSAVCGFIAANSDRITEVFQIGDFFDFTGISRWVDGSISEAGLQRELDLSRAANEQLAAYRGRKTRIMGNHDDRLRKYLATKAKGLHGLNALSYDSLTEAGRYGWETVPEPYAIAPGVVAVHGLSVRSKAGYTAHAHLDRTWSHVIHGHTHRAALVHRTQGLVTRWAMEVGCLMDPAKCTYARYPDQQLAFAVLHVHDHRVTPQLISIDTDGSFVFEGRVYR